uniref:Protein disulfide isomerase-like protein n=1 Tax=Mastigamoeba balamuthi TaxID=108607 RepID=Q86QQ7_MASBA|nr:protein disulfide isomerase-like protein [Mastigamoeba balamuthi]
MRSAAIAVVLCAVLGSALAATKGIVPADDLTFDKLVDGSRHVLVEFVENSWKHTPGIEDRASPAAPSPPPKPAAVAKELAAQDDALVVSVETTDNKELAERLGFGGASSSLPALAYFAKGAAGRQTAPAQRLDGPVTDAEAAKQFFQSAVNPSITELRGLAATFVAAGDAQKKEMLSRAEAIVAGLEKGAAQYGRFFVANMKKIVAKGAPFVQAELDRLKQLSESKATTEEKQREFRSRIGILRLFQSQPPKSEL